MNIRLIGLAAALTTSVACAMMHDSGAQSSQTLLPATSSMISLCKDNLPGTHAAAYIPWPKGTSTWLEAGECAMMVQTNIKNENDVYNLFTVPQLIVNGMPEELANYERWPADLGGSDTARCKGILAGMISQMNRQLVAACSNRGYVLREEPQKIIALAIALAYKDSTYHAQAKWDGKADQLVPFISVDHIHEDTVPVALRIDSITKTPIAENAVSGL
jgi:hypothetical protein